MKLSNGIASLGIGGGRDRTSVDYHDVRGCSFGGGGATAVKQLAFEDGTIGLRGAAAKLFDVEGRHLKPAKTRRKIQRTFHRALRGSDESVAPDQANRNPVCTPLGPGRSASGPLATDRALHKNSGFAIVRKGKEGQNLELARLAFT